MITLSHFLLTIVAGLAPGIAVAETSSSSASHKADTFAAPMQNDLIIVPQAIVAPDGSLVEGRAVIVRNGSIHAIVDAADHAENEDAVHRPGAILSPGLIDAYSALGVYGMNTERFDPFDPDISVRDAIDAYSQDWQHALEAGVTAALLVPGPNNVVSGTTALVRTGSNDGQPEILFPDAHLMLSLGAPSFSTTRAPTSLAGALSMLRNRLNDARDGRGRARLVAVVNDSLSLLIRADSGWDVTAALRLCETYGLLPVIVHSSDLLEVEEDIVESEVPVIVGPYSLDSPHHVLIAPGRLDRAGISLAFAGQLPLRSGSSLRQSAALAVRAGLRPDAARRALTSSAARIAGVQNQIGAISAGLDADLVLFSADPLRLDARVLEVYIKGELAHEAPTLGEDIERLADLDDDAYPIGDDSVTGGSDDDSE